MLNSKISRILFVCSGNTCRSPMAEGIAKNLLTNMNINDIVIQSCGTLPVANTPPSEYSIKICAEHNIDISNHLSIQINGQLVDEADLILTMENQHKKNIQKVFANSRNKTYLLTEYRVIGEAADIPDPYGSSKKIYLQVFLLLKQNIERIIKDITVDEKI